MVAAGGSTAGVVYPLGASDTATCTPALADRTPVAYSEILNDEQGATAAEFWVRAVAWFAARDVRIERVLTENGARYRSHASAAVCAAGSITHKRTRPYRPQTNGKVERFHRILLQEWAYIPDWTSETERADGYQHFLHFYNHHRPHGVLRWQPPIATLAHCQGDNLPGQHT